AIKLAEVANANYTERANAKAYAITEAAVVRSIAVTEVSPVRPTAVGRYNLTFSTPLNKTVTVEMLVVANDFQNEEAEVVYASDFAIKLSAVKEADYKELAKAKGYTILNGTTITGNVEVEVENDIRPTTVGRYTLTFRTQKGTRGTAEMLVVDNFPAEEREEIYANSFSIKLSTVANANYKELANAKAYKIFNGSVVSGIDVSVETDIRPTETGRYQLTFITANKTKKMVDMVVIADDFLDDRAEAIFANDFDINLSDIPTANYVVLAKVKAYVIINGAITSEIPVEVENNIRPTVEGIHSLTFKTAENTKITVNMTVTMDTESDKGNEVVEANSFALKLAEVGNGNYVDLAKVKAYIQLDSGVKKDIDVSIETNIRPTAVGRYNLTFTTAKGTKKAVTMIVVDNNFPPDATEVVYANNFGISLSEVATANYKDLADAKGYLIVNAREVTEVAVSVKTDIRPTRTGAYPLTFITEKGKAVTVEMLVLANDLPMRTKEVILANNFVVKQSDAIAADYVEQADARGYNIENRNNIYRVVVKVDGEKPTMLGLHDVTFVTDKATKATKKVLITNENPINNEALVAYDSTTTLEQLPRLDLVESAKAKGYDISNLENIVEIPVTFVGTRPTKADIHELRFETSKGAFAVVNLIAIQANASSFEITGNDVILELKEVRDFQQQNKLEGYIIERTAAKAIYYNGIEEVNIPVNIPVEQLTKLDAIGEHEIQVVATIQGTLSTYSVGQSTETLATQKTLTIKVSVIPDKELSKTNPDLPTTGQKIAEMLILGALLILASIIMLILLVLKRKKVNQA
ncbi:MAG: hypothetical protein ACRC6X_03235, partial [Culicoidibacterales bacterium]